MLLGVVIVLFIFAVYRAPLWWWAAFLFAAAALFWQGYGAAVWLPAFALALFSIPPLRRFLLVRPAFGMLRSQKSHVSSMEKQALTAGNAGFERGLFSGRPDWEAF